MSSRLKTRTRTRTRTTPNTTSKTRKSPSKHKGKSTRDIEDEDEEEEDFTEIVIMKTVYLEVSHINGRLFRKPRSIVKDATKKITYVSGIDKDEIDMFEPIRNEQIKHVASLLYLVNSEFYTSPDIKNLLNESFEKITLLQTSTGIIQYPTDQTRNREKNVYDHFYDVVIHPAIVKVFHYIRLNISLLLLKDKSNIVDIKRELGKNQKDVFHTIKQYTTENEIQVPIKLNLTNSFSGSDGKIDEDLTRNKGYIYENITKLYHVLFFILVYLPHGFEVQFNRIKKEFNVEARENDIQLIDFQTLTHIIGLIKSNMLYPIYGKNDSGPSKLKRNAISQKHISVNHQIFISEIIRHSKKDYTIPGGLFNDFETLTSSKKGTSTLNKISQFFTRRRSGTETGTRKRGRKRKYKKRRSIRKIKKRRSISRSD